MNVVSGALVGLVLGVAIDVAVWLWALGEALAGRVGVSVPFIVSTELDGADPVARGGLGVLLVPVVLAVIGAAVVAVVGRVRGRARARA